MTTEKMMQEQVRLIARILDVVCRDEHAIVPYITMFNIDVGMCRYCKAIGRIEHVFQVVLDHTQDCPLSLNGQLQQSLQQPQEI